ncbi:MAG: VOC family protein [Streptosporangiales bacterium]|nr:VOC family protein [Streptosporangiales bacterium]MBO0890153.1 VOC family protein [Acidothermales bacterium]
MIKNVYLMGVFVNDIDEAKDFYVDVLGFELREDVTVGDYRWLTVGVPNQPDMRVNLQVPGPPLDEEAAQFVTRMLAKGAMHAGGLQVDDCRNTYDELTAKGVEFLSEPADRPYGVEAVMRDNSGNWWVLVEPKAYTAGDFGPDADITKAAG